MGVQACRLPALKPLKPPKTLKTLKTLKTPKTLKTLQKLCGARNRAGKSYPKATNSAKAFRNAYPRRQKLPRPHQWLLMGVQACRLPALKPLKAPKTLKTLKTLKTPKTLKTLQKICGARNRAGKSYPKATNSAKASRNAYPHRQKLPQGHINGFLWASKPAACQPLNP